MWLNSNKNKASNYDTQSQMPIYKKNIEFVKETLYYIYSLAEMMLVIKTTATTHIIYKIRSNLDLLYKANSFESWVSKTSSK